MATNTHIINLTRKTQRVGTTKLAKYGPAAPAVVTIDLDALTLGGRHDLQNLIASGSVLPSASATSTKLTYTATARGRARLGAVRLPTTSAVTFNPTTMTKFQRRDLIQLLASGSVLVGDSAGTLNITIYNISSKRLRFGTASIPPKRTAGAYRATATITLTGLAASTDGGIQVVYNGVAIGSPTEYVQGTNLTAAAIQADLRTATGDLLLTVTGTTNTGPFAVTYSDGFKPLSALTVVGSVVDTLTLSNTGGAFTFKLTYGGVEDTQVYTKASNVTKAAIQARLRGLGGTLANIRVEGTTDLGPFTFAFPAGVTPLSTITVSTPTGGVTGATVAATTVGTVASVAAAPAAFLIADSTALTAKQKLDLQWLLAAGEIIVKA